MDVSEPIFIMWKKERFTRQATASLNLAQLMSKIAIRRF